MPDQVCPRSRPSSDFRLIDYAPGRFIDAFLRYSVCSIRESDKRKGTAIRLGSFYRMNQLFQGCLRVLHAAANYGSIVALSKSSGALLPSYIPEGYAPDPLIEKA